MAPGGAVEAREKKIRELAQQQAAVAAAIPETACVGYYGDFGPCSNDGKMTKAYIVTEKPTGGGTCPEPIIQDCPKPAPVSPVRVPSTPISASSPPPPGSSSPSPTPSGSSTPVWIWYLVGGFVLVVVVGLLLFLTKPPETTL